jgi:class 3 adenylate cyclase
MRRERKIVTVLFADLVGFTARRAEAQVNSSALSRSTGPSAHTCAGPEALLPASA